MKKKNAPTKPATPANPKASAELRCSALLDVHPKPKDFRVPFDTIKTYITEQGPQSHVRIVQCKPVMCEQHCIIGQLTLTQDAVRIENWLRNGGLRDIMECAQKWVLPI